MGGNHEARRRGLSVRLKLTLSYAGFLMLAGVLLLAVVWVFLLRYVPPFAANLPGVGEDGRSWGGTGMFFPGRNDLIRAFVPAVAWALVFLLVFGVLGGWVLAGRMLRPLQRITEATRKAAAGSLSHRIELDGSNDELRELADSFDGMLAKLEAHLAEQQRFAANASHELRTPLAVTQAMLEVAQADPERDVDALLTRLNAVNARAIELTEALLLLSRADRRAFARDRVDLSLLAEEAAETLLPLAEQYGVAIDVVGDEAVALGSRSLLLQVATNLLQNAIVHNLPTGGLVRLTTVFEPGRATLVVENTGGILDARRLSELTEPFVRGNERIRGDTAMQGRAMQGRARRGHAGTGLGLPIVKSIVGAHDGTLALAAVRSGGLRATVTLPGAA